MAAIPKTSVTILASAVGAAGNTTKSAPAVVGPWVDVTGYNGGLLGGRIKNNGAVGVAGNLMWQWTPDRDATTPTIYDLWGFAGDTAAGSDATFSTRLDKEVKFVRVIGWGNTTSSVNYESHLAAGA